MAGSLRDHLIEIRNKHKSLTPIAVEQEARDPKHPLHNRFEWDDTVAGYKYRLSQASEIIRSVRIVETPGEDSDLRAFVAVREKTSHKADYVPTEEAMASPFMRELVLRDMQREWETLRKRWQHMAEFADMVKKSIDPPDAATG